MPENPISYKDFMSQGLRAMGLKGASVVVIREAMRALAKEWVRRKITNAVPRESAADIADRLLGKRRPY